MLSLQEISDRLEIEDLIATYCDAIDRQDWDQLDDVFMPDATIDYTETGGSKGLYPEMKAYLAKALPAFASYQHLAATMKLKLDGDTARGRTILFNPIVVARDGQEQVFFVGLWYRDLFVRTPDGWRIADRYEEKSYFHNVPSWFAPE